MVDVLLATCLSASPRRSLENVLRVGPRERFGEESFHGTVEEFVILPRNHVSRPGESVR